MEDSVNSASPLSDAAAVHANHFQFSPGERLTNRCVGSRALVWGIRGSGSLRTGGRSVALPPGTAVILPWRHDVTYEAAPIDPFLVGAVHVVPWHDRAVRIEARAAHGMADPLAGVDHRRDVEVPGLTGVRILTGRAPRSLIRLGELAVETFSAGDVEEDVMRAYGLLVTTSALRLPRDTQSVARSAALQSMQTYVRSHLAEHLTTDQIATAAGCSVSTTQRIFRRGTGMSVQAWVTSVRVAEASRLLRTSSLRVSEIARRTGFADPLYFSRVFRAARGQAPTAFRAAVPPL